MDLFHDPANRKISNATSKWISNFCDGINNFREIGWIPILKIGIQTKRTLKHLKISEQLIMECKKSI